jgi:hypothetical protein
VSLLRDSLFRHRAIPEEMSAARTRRASRGSGRCAGRRPIVPPPSSTARRTTVGHSRRTRRGAPPARRGAAPLRTSACSDRGRYSRASRRARRSAPAPLGNQLRASGTVGQWGDADGAR